MRPGTGKRLQQMLRYLLAFQLSHPLTVVIIAVALSAASMVFTLKNLAFQTDQRALMSHDRLLLQRLEEADRVSDLDAFVVAIENRETSRTLDFVRSLTPKLEKDRNHFEHVFSRMNPARFRPWVLLYLKEKDLLELGDNLQEYESVIKHLAESPSLATFFESINSTMTSAMVDNLFTGFFEQHTGGTGGSVKLDFLIDVLREMRDGIGGKGQFVSPWRSFFVKENWKSEDEGGYLWTENKRYLLVFVTPVMEGGGFSKAQQALVALRQIVAATKRAFPDVEAGVTGQKALDEDQKYGALRDASLATVLSFLGLAILLLLFWRGLRRPLLSITVLVVTLCLTFGFTTLIVGHLNILSVAFAPMILGLGIDYGIHWFARYDEERRRLGDPAAGPMAATMMSVGPPIVLAGVCAALSFFPFMLTGFRGLVELGVICSMGIMLAILVTLCLLPALVVLFSGRSGSRPVTSPPKERETKALFDITFPRALLILALTAAASIVSLWASGKTRFDLNMLRLQPKNSESVVWERKLIEASKYPSINGVVFAHSRDEVEEKTEALERLPTVSEVQNINKFLPSDQYRKIHLLEGMRPLLAGITSIPPPSGPVDINRIDNVFSRIRFKMHDTGSAESADEQKVEARAEEVRALIDSIRNDFRSMERRKLANALKTFEQQLLSDLNDKLSILVENMNTRPMGISDLPEALRSRFVSPNNLYVIRVFPARDIWEPRFLAPFVRDLTSVAPDAVGDPVMLYTTTRAFRDASIRAAIYAMVFVCLFLLLTSRSIVSTIAALSPFLIGTLWTFGLMHFFGVDLNLANSVFLPLVVGAGVEYGIIIVGRWRENGPRRVFNLPSSTGAGVVLAGLSTTVGFGSLIISSHQGIHSLGVLATVGSLSVLAAAILFLPSLLRVLSGRQMKEGRAGLSEKTTLPHGSSEIP